MGVLTPLVVLSGVVLAILFGLVNIEHPFIAEKFVHLAASRWDTGVFCFEFAVDNTLRAYGEGVVAGASIDKLLCDNTMQVYNKEKLFLNLAKGGGTIGLGEAYHNGYWGVDASTQDLGDLLTHLFYNSQKMEVGVFQFIKLYLSIYEWKEYLHRLGLTKDKSTDMKDVSGHYFDSDFFKAFLDDTMTYTCGMWNKETKTLRDATMNKIEILLKKLQIEQYYTASDDSDDTTIEEKTTTTTTDIPQILDIGCGWGFLPSYIANKTTANVTGITIAHDQYQFAVEKYGHLPRTHYRLFDFRDLITDYGPQYFDRIISVGVISHIHIKRLSEWMRISYDALKPGGICVMQGITVTMAWNNALPARHWTTKEKACQGYNYITKYIFPGACLLLSDWIYDEALRAGFVVLHRESFGLHYARTLRAWRDNLIANKSIIPQRHSNEKLLRQYELYLAHAEASYRIGIIDKAHFVFYKPPQGVGSRGAIHTKGLNAISDQINLVWQ